MFNHLLHGVKTGHTPHQVVDLWSSSAFIFLTVKSLVLKCSFSSCPSCVLSPSCQRWESSIAAWVLKRSTISFKVSNPAALFIKSKFAGQVLHFLSWLQSPGFWNAPPFQFLCVRSLLYVKDQSPVLQSLPWLKVLSRSGVITMSVKSWVLEVSLQTLRVQTSLPRYQAWDLSSSIAFVSWLSSHWFWKCSSSSMIMQSALSIMSKIRVNYCSFDWMKFLSCCGIIT